MSRRRSRSDGDYAVGYGKPPEQHRFKPGNSGRPKGSHNKAGSGKELTCEKLTCEELTQQLLRRKTRVKRDDRVIEIGFGEMIVARLHSLAMQGTARDLTTVLAFVERYMPKAVTDDHRLDIVHHRAGHSDVVLPPDDLWQDTDD